MDVGTIAALWRYPVKSLRAESLDRATVLADGLEGDRTAALLVTDADHPRAGKPFRGKESPRLHLTDSVDTAVADAASRGAAVVLDRAAKRYFDLRTVSLVFDTWVGDVEALVGEAFDPLRWRPNVLVTALPAYAGREADLVGCTLSAGGVVLRVEQPIHRCVTTTYDVATGEALPAVLREVALHRANVLGIYCEVVAPGTLAVDDIVQLLG